jgi:outer membrane protein OmpA-like peptidoglycan-associated protein
MTSFVRFFGIKAITISAALTMTAGLALAGDNTPSAGSIVDALKPAPRTRSLSSFDTNKATRDSTINRMRNRSTRSLSMDDRNQLEVAIADRPKIDLEINFDYNSAAISQNSMAAVQHLGEALSDPQLKGSTFVVSGHTDGVGGEEFNQGLSERRADTIKRYLVDNYHIAGSDLITVGYGKTRLKDTANPADPVNRRVQVINTQTTNTAASQ